MLPSSVRIFVCTAPQDMRRSFDGLALAASRLLGQDPRSGALFVVHQQALHASEGVVVGRERLLPLVQTAA
jgi:hypothetical protein